MNPQLAALQRAGELGNKMQGCQQRHMQQLGRALSSENRCPSDSEKGPLTNASSYAAHRKGAHQAGASEAHLRRAVDRHNRYLIRVHHMRANPASPHAQALCRDGRAEAEVGCQQYPYNGELLSSSLADLVSLQAENGFIRTATSEGSSRNRGTNLPSRSNGFEIAPSF